MNLTTQVSKSMATIQRELKALKLAFEANIHAEKAPPSLTERDQAVVLGAVRTALAGYRNGATRGEQRAPAPARTAKAAKRARKVKGARPLDRSKAAVQKRRARSEAVVAKAHDLLRDEGAGLPIGRLLTPLRKGGFRDLQAQGLSAILRGPAGKGKIQFKGDTYIAK
jgi:hypothetical protein